MYIPGPSRLRPSCADSVRGGRGRCGGGLPAGGGGGRPGGPGPPAAVCPGSLPAAPGSSGSRLQTGTLGHEESAPHV